MNKGRDLGTYHIRAIFEDGDGFIYKYNTGRRYGGGTNGISPLVETAIPPCWDTEEHMIRTMQYSWYDGNYSCDCNLKNFLDDAHQRERPKDYPCGETIKLKQLILIKPDGTEVDISR